MTSKPSIPEHNGKRIGNLSQDGQTYMTRRTRDFHLARRHNGYGIQSTTLKTLLAAKVQRIRVIETVHEKGVGPFRVEYESTPELWTRHGVLDILRADDGAQRFLSLKQLREHTESLRGVARVQDAGVRASAGIVKESNGTLSCLPMGQCPWRGYRGHICIQENP